MKRCSPPSILAGRQLGRPALFPKKNPRECEEKQEDSKDPRQAVDDAHKRAFDSVWWKHDSEDQQICNHEDCEPD
jgi:hypothetical protein